MVRMADRSAACVRGIPVAAFLDARVLRPRRPIHRQSWTLWFRRPPEVEGPCMNGDGVPST